MKKKILHILGFLFVACILSACSSFNVTSFADTHEPVIELPETGKLEVILDAPKTFHKSLMIVLTDQYGDSLLLLAVPEEMWKLSDPVDAQSYVIEEVIADGEADENQYEIMYPESITVLPNEVSELKITVKEQTGDEIEKSLLKRISEAFVQFLKENIYNFIAIGTCSFILVVIRCIKGRKEKRKE